MRSELEPLPAQAGPDWDGPALVYVETARSVAHLAVVDPAALQEGAVSPTCCRKVGTAWFGSTRGLVDVCRPCRSVELLERQVAQRLEALRGPIPDLPDPDYQAPADRASQARLESLEGLVGGIGADLDEYEARAWDAMSRYKLWMFGYWAARWIGTHALLRRAGLATRPSNPFKPLVHLARVLGHGQPARVAAARREFAQALADLGVDS